MVKGLLEIEVERALKAGGCPMCASVQNSVSRYLYSLLYEFVNDTGLRAKLARSRGFCREHAWQLQKMESSEWGDGMGTAILHEQLLGQWLQELDGASKVLESSSRRSGWRKAWGRVLRLVGYAGKHPAEDPALQRVTRQHTSTEPCPVCRIAAQAEEIFAFGLLESISDAGFRKLYQASEGLCIPHLVQILGANEFGEDHKSKLVTLLDLERHKITLLLDELKEYLRKHNYLYAHEPKGNEQTSWIRAVRKAVGNERTNLFNR